ncbi:MAG: glycosyltransferase [Eubacterium sp.]|nr:glycosyltransferase [Eubacterium sp.]
MKHVGVDIIIPIFNAYDDVLKCVESVWKWTDLKTHRLVLVNDCSTDTRIMPYLERQKGRGCIVIHNKTNQGFSAGINIGMAQSEDRDVILLNSDTVVTKGWVEKMSACAYSNPWTGTVTPLSNNATLCSVPVFCKENRLPRGYTLDEFAGLIESASLKKYPVIPVANGFCMFIKREVIRLIGNFDAKSFDRGYGEENDFCCRAIIAGYHHVMCDDTYILHTGTSSFLEADKKKYMTEHEKILERRYPKLMQAVRVHCADHPTAVITENIRMHMTLDRCRRRKTIMYLMQSDFRKEAENSIGGIQLHVKDLMQGLRSSFNILTAARNKDYLDVVLYTDHEEADFKFHIGEKTAYPVFRSEEYADLYGKILDAFRVECVHVHHVMHLTLELYYAAADRKIPVVTSLHDYYFLCPDITLLNEEHKPCICCTPDGRQVRSTAAAENPAHVPCNCARCLERKKKVASTIDYISIWRRQHGIVLNMSEQIIVPSFSAKQMVERIYADDSLKAKITVMEHGSAAAGRTGNGTVNKAGGRAAFRVAFLGAINEAKGFSLAHELIRTDSSVQWYLFGYFERKTPVLNKRDNFHNMGVYKREELPGLLRAHKINLVCILSKCPETYCYTLSEAAAAGVPVLVTDCGALGERVRSLGCGWVVSGLASAEEVAACIKAIRKNREEYRRMMRSVGKLRLKSAHEMCQEYKQVYQAVFQKKDSCTNACEYKEPDYKWLIENYASSGRRMASYAEIQMRLAAAERYLNEMNHSITFRAARKLSGLPFPFRRQIKWILQNIWKIT